MSSETARAEEIARDLEMCARQIETQLANMRFLNGDDACIRLKDPVWLVGLLRQASAALRASPPPSGCETWRTIETAPRDGKPFLAAHEASGVRQVTWYGKASHVPLYGWAICPDGDPEEIDLWQPTHWQPLPAPPLPTPALTNTTGKADE